MEPDAYLKLAQQQLEKSGNRVSNVPLKDYTALVGYQSQFKWSWFATKIHLFTVFIVIPELKATLYNDAVSQALDYGLQMKGTLRGLQVGVAVTPIIVTQAVDTETQQIAEARPSKHFAAITTPAVIDITNNQLHTYTGKIVWGSAYTKWLRERMQAALPSIEPGALTKN